MIKTILLIFLFPILLFGQTDFSSYSYDTNTRAFTLYPSPNIQIFDVLISTNFPPKANSWRPIYRVYNIDNRKIEIEVNGLDTFPWAFLKVETNVIDELCLGNIKKESIVFDEGSFKYKWADMDTNIYALIVEVPCIPLPISLDTDISCGTNKFFIKGGLCNGCYLGHVENIVGFSWNYKTNFVD